MQGIEVHVLKTLEQGGGASLTEIMRREQTPEKPFGQLSIVKAIGCAASGNHYHTHRAEWICVLRGTGQLDLQDVRTAERESLIIGQEHMVIVKVPPFVSHTITSMDGSELLALVYLEDMGDDVTQDDNDTYMHILHDNETVKV